MPHLLAGKTAVITGAAAGIGTREGYRAGNNPSRRRCVHKLPGREPSLFRGQSARRGQVSAHQRPVLRSRKVWRDKRLRVQRWRVSVPRLPRPAQRVVRPHRTDQPRRSVLRDESYGKDDGRAGPQGSIIGISSRSAQVGGAGQTHFTPTKAEY